MQPTQVRSLAATDTPLKQSYLPPQLEHFLAKRNAAWERSVGKGLIPAWLVSWVRMAQALAPGAQPDYQVIACLAGGAAGALHLIHASQLVGLLHPLQLPPTPTTKRSSSIQPLVQAFRDLIAAGEAEAAAAAAAAAKAAAGGRSAAWVQAEE